MTNSWQPIYLSAKVFGHLAQGLYRTPAGAIKELISNSFDADATLVRIHTGFPRFETFSCEDNGTGMSRNEFQRLMNRGIGSSYKRSSTVSVTEMYERPLIGRLGLGILSLAQVCTGFEILSHHKETKICVSRNDPVSAIHTKGNGQTRQTFARRKRRGADHGGKYQISEEQYDPSKHGVRVFTKYLRESFRKRMRSLQHFANKKILVWLICTKHSTRIWTQFTVPQRGCSLSISFPTMTSCYLALLWPRPCPL